MIWIIALSQNRALPFASLSCDIHNELCRRLCGSASAIVVVPHQQFSLLDNSSKWGNFHLGRPCQAVFTTCKVKTLQKELFADRKKLVENQWESVMGKRDASWRVGGWRRHVNNYFALRNNNAIHSLHIIGKRYAVEMSFWNHVPCVHASEKRARKRKVIKRWSGMEIVERLSLAVPWKYHSGTNWW